MAAAYTHAQSSAKRWGGEPEEYLEIHKWFDDSKNAHGDYRHRALRHHTHGIGECLALFGESLELSTGRTIPTRWVCEQHLQEDFGFLPTLQDWLKEIRPQGWMVQGAQQLSKVV